MGTRLARSPFRRPHGPGRALAGRGLTRDRRAVHGLVGRGRMSNPPLPGLDAKAGAGRVEAWLLPEGTAKQEPLTGIGGGRAALVTASWRGALLGLVARLGLLIGIWCGLGVVGPPVAAAGLSSVPGRPFVTDGTVRAVLPLGDTVYIGGDFGWVGPRTGPAAAI